MVHKKTFALLASAENDSFDGLRIFLKTQGAEMKSVQGYEEAARLVEQTHPELIFTTAILSDGTWRDIVRLAERISVPTNVIVVGTHKDFRLYLSAIDYGAFDCIFPPFASHAVAPVIQAAVKSVSRRKEAQALKAVA